MECGWIWMEHDYCTVCLSYFCGDYRSPSFFSLLSMRLIKTSNSTSSRQQNFIHNLVYILIISFFLFFFFFFLPFAFFQKSVITVSLLFFSGVDFIPILLQTYSPFSPILSHHHQYTLLYRLVSFFDSTFCLITRLSIRIFALSQ